jgi:tRNA(fMet)-specific endonuclease VapC
MYLLDTDTLTHLHAGNSNVTERLKSAIDVEVGITIITKVEVLRGRIDYLIKAESGESLIKAQELLFRTEELLNDLLIVPIELLQLNLICCGMPRNFVKLAEQIC